MQIVLEGDSSFSCGIMYSQVAGSKSPRREGEGAGGACVVFREGFIDIPWSSTHCRACRPLTPDMGELCSSPLRGIAVQPGFPSFAASACQKGDKPAGALRHHGTSTGYVHQGSSIMSMVGYHRVSHRLQWCRRGALLGEWWRRRLEELPPPSSLPAPLPGGTGL